MDPYDAIVTAVGWRHGAVAATKLACSELAVDKESRSGVAAVVANPTSKNMWPRVQTVGGAVTFNMAEDREGRGDGGHRL